MNTDRLAGSLDRRRAGILLHITSLPGAAQTGDLGAEAYHFVDFIQQTGASVWQILPVGPTHEDGSPYQSSSMHAGNPRLISVQPLVDEGWLSAQSLPRKSVLTDAEKTKLLRMAWHGFQGKADESIRHEMALFIEQEGFWLEDYALFRALHDEHELCWWKWPSALRDRDPQALEQAREWLAGELDYIRFEQFQFFRQWMSLKRYANDRGILLFGDMPLFVAHDSAEVWARQQMFALDAGGLPQVVAGVPPDYFSETGQRWGNPLYRWERMEADGFSYWVERMCTQLRLFDLVRIDHFRGLEAYWEIPAEEEYAINGRWVEAPGDALFDRLHEIYDPLPLVAEDLGIITHKVEALREKYGLPGMNVLQFAFSGGADNPYLPFRHHENSVVYTGTHDNDTSLGWYVGLEDGARQFVDEYLGFSREVMPWPLIRMALASRSRLAVIPMQDLLGLDSQHRMNLPGTIGGNWQWRFEWDQVDEELAPRLRRRIEIYGRLA